LPQGTDFVAKVTVWNTYRNGGLTTIAIGADSRVPSGWANNKATPG